MREIIIDNREAGQRFDKYLRKYLSHAGSGFIYRMLRKKNIVLNGRRAAGSEILSEGDSVRMFFSEETFEKFTSVREPDVDSVTVMEDERRFIVCGRYKVEILYENNDVIFFNKPAGLLSQGDGKGDISLVDIFASYLMRSEGRTGAPSGYRPGICNRLDRNTSGVVAAGKTVRGLKELSGLIRNRSVRKIYLCIVEGEVRTGGRLKGYLTKDTDNNVVFVSGKKTEGSSEIETLYTPLKCNGTVTMLEVELITGKSHQIRAHMAHIGHPVLGDGKYGSSMKRPGRYQLLHSYKMIFGRADGILRPLSEKEITTGIPPVFDRLFDMP